MDFDPRDRSRELPLEPELVSAIDDRPLLQKRQNQVRFYFAMAMGGVIGTLVRVKLALVMVSPPTGIPWATFVVNISGAFLLGAILVFINEHRKGTPVTQAFLATGICGSLTTFSTLVWQADNLSRTGHWSIAIAYVAMSVVVGLIAVIIGMAVARQFDGKLGAP